LESAAEKEREWSAAEKVLTARFSTLPNLLQAILFFRLNQKYWTKCTVSKAIKMAQDETSSKHYKKEVGQFGALDESDD
jgi:hypothetical protein